MRHLLPVTGALFEIVFHTVHLQVSGGAVKKDADSTFWQIEALRLIGRGVKSRSAKLQIF